MTHLHLVEKSILDDIKNRTGLSFAQIGAISTRDKAVADLVLPVLKEWVPFVKEANIRGAIFHRFGPHSDLFLNSLLAWWQMEEDQINASILTQAIVAAAKPINSVHIWRVAQHEAKKPFYFMLLAKLTAFPSVAAEVKDVLANALNEGAVPEYELTFVARVGDERIRRWFESQVESPDVKVRQVARRVVAKGRKLPPSVMVSTAPPDRSAAIFSTEVDLVAVEKTMEKIAGQLDLKIPAALRTASFLSSVQVDQWVKGHIKAAGCEVFDLWLRLEDIDTVEILITRSAE